MPHQPRLMSFAQQRLWFLDQLEAGSTAYHLSAARRLEGPLQIDALQCALDEVVRRHDVLRTTFDVADDVPLQLISDWEGPRLRPAIDLQHLPARDEALARRMRAEVARPFDLRRGPLLRASVFVLAPREHVLLIAQHHIVTDEWSRRVLLGELAALYRAFASGEPSPLPALPMQYADYAEWQREQEQRLAVQRQYWQRHLDGLPSTDLLTDHARPPRQTFRGARCQRRLPSALSQSVRDLARQQRATPYITMLAAFFALLRRYTGQEDLAIGCPIANRSRAELEPLIGLFINMLVLRTSLTGDPTFREAVARVRQVALEAYQHQELPFEQLVDALNPERDLRRHPLVQILFHMNRPATEPTWGDLTARAIDTAQDTSVVDLTLHVNDGPDGLDLEAMYAADLFTPPTMEAFLRHYVRVLEDVTADPDRRLSELTLLDSHESRQLLVEWDHRRPELYPDICLHTLFEAEVDRRPDAPAISLRGAETSYAALEARANRIAHGLAGLGRRPPRRVGVLLPTGVEQIAALLGILKTGAAFVCLDPRLPTARLAQMLDDAAPDVVLLDRSLPIEQDAIGGVADRIATMWIETRAIADVPASDDGGGELFDGASTTRPALAIEPCTPAFVVYTSGTSGRPKGIIQSHRSFSQFVRCQAKPFDIGPGTRFAQWASCAYDASYCEIFGALCLGATLCLDDPAVRFDPAAAIAWVARERVTHLQVVPSFARQLLARLTAGAGRDWDLTALEYMLLAGEPLPVDLADDWKRRFPSRPRLFNLYGPSEAVLATWHEVDHVGSGQRSVPVGRALEGRHVLVLDAHGRLSPPRVPGEIHIRSAHLADGYLNLPEATARAFVPNPLTCDPRDRVYRTGDVGRWLTDGRLECLGRRDRQIKIRGNRVELAEVEAVLAAHPAVRDAAVTVHSHDEQDQRLAAFVVLREAGLAIAGEADLQARYLEECRHLYDEIYDLDQARAQLDPHINARSWTSSYTNRPLAEVEVLEAVDDTVQRILALQPRRVLEIGAGTGLLLFRIAPHTLSYHATDASEASVRYLRRELAALATPLKGVTVERRTAHELGDLSDGAFDLIVLNLVTQHFPSGDYLRRVVDGAIRLVAADGVVFVGGVRSLPLLHAFHASVQLAQAAERDTRQELRGRVEARAARDKDLLIAPEFFAAAAQAAPRRCEAHVIPKGGRHANEITAFQFDALLQVEPADRLRRPVPWRDWRAAGMDLMRLRDLLAQDDGGTLAFTAVPNARVTAGRAAWSWMSNDDSDEVGARAADLRARVDRLLDPAAQDPAALRALADDWACTVDLWCTQDAGDGSFDLLIERGRAADRRRPPLVEPPRPVAARAWSDYTNRPLHRLAIDARLAELRDHVRERLPDYMVPSTFVCLESLPRTTSGKVAWHALERPDDRRRLTPGSFRPPSTATEKRVAAIWRDVLGLEHVGLDDNFFDLGGHSLLATQVLNRARSQCGFEISLRHFLEAPTIAALARQMEADRRTAAAEAHAIAEVLAEVKAGARDTWGEHRD